MSLRRVLLVLSLAVALVCLSGGHGMTGLWAGAGAVLLPVLALLFSHRLTATWLPTTCLVSLVCLAAAGLLTGAPAYLMIPGATAALAAWDLANLDRLVVKDSSSPSTARRFERRHSLSLATALGLGLLLAGSGMVLSLEVPFALLILLIVLDLFSMDRWSRYL